MDDRRQNKIILDTLNNRYILIYIILICGMVFPLTSEAARIIVNTGQDSIENCSFRQAVAVINRGAVFSNGDCTNSGGPFGQNDSIDFESDISRASLGIDSFAFLNITNDVSINEGGPRIAIDGEMTPRTVLMINSGAQVKLHNLLITGGVAGVFFETRAGGIYVDNASLTLTESLISGNTVSSGGTAGIAINNSTVTIRDSEISENITPISAGSAIGGISTSNSSVVRLVNSTVSNNSSGSGGGIASYNSYLEVINSTISANENSTYWVDSFSGIGIFSGTAHIYNSTITDNVSPVTLEQFNIAASLGGHYATIVLKNTIIANNVGQPACVIGQSEFDTSTISFDGPNLVEDGSCGSTALSNVIKADPKLDKLRSNGGKTPTHALLVGSPAIDSGDNLTCATVPVNNSDQRGYTRPVGVNCDLGAFEGTKLPVDGIVPPIILLLLDEE